MMKKISKLSALLFMAILIVLSILRYYTGNTSAGITSADNSMKVHYMDVGQGDCVFIESDKKYMLIDAGKSEKAEKIISYLKDVGVKKLDYVILTHPDSDHIGGASKILKTFDIGKIIMPNKTHTSKTYANLLETIQSKGLKITVAKPGTEYTLGNTSFTIIAPVKTYDDNNNSSVGLRLVNDKTSFLFIGDGEKEAINDILKNNLVIESTVLMAGHHGSDTSTTKEWVKAVNPDYAVISVGEDNNYGHPSDNTLKLFRDNKIKIYRTDISGTIMAASTGTKITFNTKAYKPDTTKVTNTPLQGTTIYITKTGKKYHLKSCPALGNNKIKTSLKEAKDKGLEPCKKCNPPK